MEYFIQDAPDQPDIPGVVNILPYLSEQAIANRPPVSPFCVDTSVIPTNLRVWYRLHRTDIGLGMPADAYPVSRGSKPEVQVPRMPAQELGGIPVRLTLVPNILE